MLCKASVVLPLVQAQAVIRASGKHKGITCRPWMLGGDSPVPGAMLWVCLPAPARAPLPDLWAKLASDPQICGQFGGLISGHQEGRVGICFFGAQQVPQGVIQAVGDPLGAEITPRKVVVRVRGYPISYGSPADGWVAFHWELPGVFGGVRGIFASSDASTSRTRGWFAPDGTSPLPGFLRVGAGSSSPPPTPEAATGCGR